MKEKLDQIMDKIRENNPDANWANLLTGIGILVLIAVASIWYFGKMPVEEVEDLVPETTEERDVEVDAGNGGSAVSPELSGDKVVVDAGDRWVAGRVWWSCTSGERAG